MEFSPRVSVVVPVFNAEDYIANCINSLLNLNYPKEKYEIIVVNNASSDNTEFILNKYENQIKLLYECKKGASAARNKGISCSESDIIAFTDADCLAERDWLLYLVKHLDNRNVGIVGGKIKSFTPCNYIEKYGDIINDNERSLKDNTLPFCISMNCASRLSILKESGMFDENLLRSHDVDLSWRLLKSGFDLVYESNAVIYHKHIDNLTDLFYKGFIHGFYGSKLLRKHGDFLVEKDIRRVYWSTYIDIYKSLLKVVSGEQQDYSLCNLVFNTGKKLGKYSGSVRFRYLNL